MVRSLPLSLAVATLLFFGNAAAEKITVSDEQQRVSLTVYNTNLAMVRDSRKVDVPVGEHLLEFQGISAGIQPETASLAGEKVRVLEQRYDVDLLSPESLLQNYVGRDVTIVRVNPASGEESQVQARVLSTAGGGVFQVGDHLETDLDGRMLYPDLPNTLRIKPALSMLVENEFSGKQKLELSYLTEGLAWRADYVAQLHDGADRLDLKAWVTLSNKSGSRYGNARLQLVAGDVNRVDESRAVMPMALSGTAEAMTVRGRDAVQQEALAGYHLYTIDRPTTLADNQVKQIALLQENNGTCRRELVLRSGNQNYYWAKVGQISKEEGVEAFIYIQNDKASGFGSPKPAGTVRVYQKDGSGFSQFIGEDFINHTPEDKEMRIALGRSFDVTADRLQTDFSASRGLEDKSRVHESAYAITLQNAEDQDVEVTVEENLPGDWEILSESLPHNKVNATTVSWKVNVGAKGSSVLQYRLRSVIQ